MLYLLKQLSFHYGFYDIVLVKNIYLLAGHLLKFKFCCQPCDVIFCQKPLKSKKKTYKLLYGAQSSTILETLHSNG